MHKLLLSLTALAALFGVMTQAVATERSTNATMDAGARALAIEEIKNLKARYCRGVDMEDRDLLRSALADDVITDYTATWTEGSPTPKEKKLNYGGDKSADVIIAAQKNRSAISKKLTFHFVGNPEIQILSATTAKGIWPMMGGWYYHETYERIAGEWKIKTLRFLPNTKETPARISDLAMPPPK